MPADQIAFYPVVVLEGRYGGTYARGRWLAVACADERMPGTGASRFTWVLEDGPGGDDVTSAIFGGGRPPAWIAVADTPDQAVARLRADDRPDDEAWTTSYLTDDHPLAEKWRDFQGR